jgi:hypothetical protein
LQSRIAQLLRNSRAGPVLTAKLREPLPQLLQAPLGAYVVGICLFPELSDSRSLSFVRHLDSSSQVVTIAKATLREMVRFVAGPSMHWVRYWQVTTVLSSD